MKVKVNNFWFVAILVLVVAAVPGLAFAAVPNINPGRDLATWAYNNIMPFFSLGLAAASLWFLFRREFTAFVSFIVFALIVAILVYFPDSVKSFANTIWQAITG